MWLDVNGERQQTGSTATMVFSWPKLISYVSQFLTLLPGDVDHDRHAARRRHPARSRAAIPQCRRFMTLGIDGLGTQRQHIVAA